MSDYSKGKVYKIEPMYEHDEKDIYIGSTIQPYLSNRMATHRKDYKKWKEGKVGKCTSFDLFDKYGIDNCNIILLESINAQNKDELHAKEAYYINSFDCVNKYNPEKRTEEMIKEQKKQYYEANKEHLTQKKKEYYETNKEKMDEYYKEWRENNKDLKKELDKKYREENKDKIKARKLEKVTCECGTVVCRDALSRHKKSITHQEFLKK